MNSPSSVGIDSPPPFKIGSFTSLWHRLPSWLASIPLPSSASTPTPLPAMSPNTGSTWPLGIGSSWSLRYQLPPFLQHRLPSFGQTPLPPLASTSLDPSRPAPSLSSETISLLDRHRLPSCVGTGSPPGNTPSIGSSWPSRRLPLAPAPLPCPFYSFPSRHHPLSFPSALAPLALSFFTSLFGRTKD